MKKVLFACLFLLCPVVATAQDAASAVNFADPAFDRYVDIAALGAAWENQDAAALTDAALQLAEGEKALFRSHSAFTAKDVFAKALAVAADQKDKATLERLDRIAKASGDNEFATKVTQTARLSAESRSILPNPTHLKIADDIEKTNHFYFDMSDLISRIRVSGDKKGLAILRDHIKQVSPAGAVTQESLDSLVQLANESEATMGNVPEAEQNVGIALEKLAGESRNDLRKLLQAVQQHQQNHGGGFHGGRGGFHGGHGGFHGGHGGWGPGNSLQTPNYRYTEFNSMTLGPIIIRTDQWGNRSWRPRNAPLASPWRTGAF